MQYIHELGPLFHDVQMAAILPDGKTFPDCLPKASLQTIAEQYETQKAQPGFDLKAFVVQHFDLPPMVGSDFVSDPARSPEQHVEALWDVLTRQPDKEPVSQSSLLPLPNPYVVPGGRFREVYYWDSYFTMLGLRAQGRWDLIEHMVANFAYLIEQNGFIPNGNRSYYLGRSQPPFFSLMVRLLAEHKGEQVISFYIAELLDEYSFWMQSTKGQRRSAEKGMNRLVALGDDCLMNRYWDEFDTPRPESYREDVELSMTSMQPSPQLYRNIRAAAESGWDFSSRWFGDRTGFASICTTDIVPVDLNCLLWHLEETLLEGFKQLNENDKGAIEKTHEMRKLAINRYFWDETDGFYFDYNFRQEKRTNHRTLAAMYPLFFKLASQEQADAVANIIENDFLKPGGLTTTLLETGQQWDAPNGWAPLQWISFIGLKNYGHDRLANEVRTRWLNTVESVYHKTGKMTEKYNVLNDATHAGGGEYENQDGFGWTNGVFLGMKV